MSVAEILSLAGITLIFVGILIIIAAIILLTVRSVGRGKGKVRGGGVVMIGPIR